MVSLFGPPVNGYGIEIEIERLDSESDFDLDLDGPNLESKIWKNQVIHPVPEEGGMQSTFLDRERLARTFSELVRIDSVSREEGRICRQLQFILGDIGLSACVDDAGAKVGSETGNLIGRFAGNRKVAPLLLCAHMDTVEPGRGIQPVFKDGVFASRGETILGADDKAGLAIIIETLRCVRESGLPCGPLEIVFTVCEEIGLLGAKHLDFDQLAARMGYVLDTRNPDVIVTRAPAANRLRLKIEGRAAHAGAEPEKGINAISVAAQAISGIALGRIDAETTCNLGKIEGGVATNIVPPEVVVHGEVRSHDTSKLEAATQSIVEGFRKAVEGYVGDDSLGRPRLETEIHPDFDRMQIADAHPTVALARQAAARLNRKLYPATSGGGSDANVFAKHAIITGILGTGCEKVHTLEERVALDDMVRATELLTEILRIHAGD
jgi:tripeptide aminopeptidase